MTRIFVECNVCEPYGVVFDRFFSPAGDQGKVMAREKVRERYQKECEELGRFCRPLCKREDETANIPDTPRFRLGKPPKRE